MLNIDKWTTLDKTLEQRNSVLVSIFAILGIITTVIQIINDMYYGIYISVSLDFAIMCSLIIVYVLNEKRKHFIAKILFLGFVDILLFLFANLIPKEVGVYFIFFPMLAISALIFNPNQNWARNIFIVLPFILLVVLELSNYHFFGNINIQGDVDVNSSYFINLFVSLAIMILALLYLSSINRKIEDGRTHIQQELKKANSSLQKSNKELDHFVYSTSHDLKAPLSSISGLLNIARYDVTDKKANEYFDMIDERVDRLNLFIKDIIDLSRNSRLEVEKEKVNVKEIVVRAIDNNRYISKTESINFNIDIPEEYVIEIDRPRFEVMLNNLVSNAIKYHKEEGDRFVFIQAVDLNKNIVINIEDNGIGISQKHQKRIFDMFYRGHEDSEGSGLGLYIVKDVVDKLKGKISLESVPEEGTKISIRLPK